MPFVLDDLVKIFVIILSRLTTSTNVHLMGTGYVGSIRLPADIVESDYGVRLSYASFLLIKIDVQFQLKSRILK